MDIDVTHVQYIPKELEPQTLYVSDEYQVAVHLCPCGCGTKVTTPLGENEWTLTENAGKATLFPSLGNWELPCKSHYWVKKGRIIWSYQWTEEQIEAGRKAEEKARITHFSKTAERKKHKYLLSTFWDWIWNK